MILSYWCQLIEGFQASPKDVYKCIEDALQRRQVPELRGTRVLLREGSIISANREYLRLSRKKLFFDICAAPFGTGFFVSIRLCEKESRLAPFFQWLFGRYSYYSIDLTEMFRSAVHAAVMEIIDKQTEVQKLRPLSELERKPVFSKLLMS